MSTSPVRSRPVVQPPVLIDAAEAVDRGGHPARRRPPPASHHSYKSDAAWGHAAEDSLTQPESPTGPSRMPRVSQPLRVEPPPEYNAPARVQRLPQRAMRGNPASDVSVLSSKLARRPMVGAPTAKSRPEKIKDYSVLAAACQRAGRQTRAAHLVFNQGVLYENMGEDDQALRCYKVCGQWWRWWWQRASRGLSPGAAAVSAATVAGQHLRRPVLVRQPPGAWRPRCHPRAHVIAHSPHSLPPAPNPG